MMISKFMDKLGEGLSARWLEHLFSPALLFWGGGLLIVGLRMGCETAWTQLKGLDVNAQIALVLVGLLLVMLSSKLMEELCFSFLRLLEGYWRTPLAWLAEPLRRWQWRRIEKGRNRWNELMARREKGPLAYAEARELARLDVEGHYAPALRNDCLPTALGNILRAAEAAPRERYGLDAVICWPRLWMLLPQEVRQVLGESRRALDLQVELWAWGLLFLGWVFLWPWAALIAIGWMWLAYALMLDAARIYADLLESAFDLYRWKLYEAAGWEKPALSGEAEIALGQRLTEFFWRGTSAQPIPYKQPSAPGGGSAVSP